MPGSRAAVPNGTDCHQGQLERTTFTSKGNSGRRLEPEQRPKRDIAQMRWEEASSLSLQTSSDVHLIRGPSMSPDLLLPSPVSDRSQRSLTVDSSVVDRGALPGAQSFAYSMDKSGAVDFVDAQQRNAASQHRMLLLEIEAALSRHIKLSERVSEEGLSIVGPNSIDSTWLGVEKSIYAMFRQVEELKRVGVISDLDKSSNSGMTRAYADHPNGNNDQIVRVPKRGSVASTYISTPPRSADPLLQPYYDRYGDYRNYKDELHNLLEEHGRMREERRLSRLSGAQLDLSDRDFVEVFLQEFSAVQMELRQAKIDIERIMVEHAQSGVEIPSIDIFEPSSVDSRSVTNSVVDLDTAQRASDKKLHQFYVACFGTMIEDEDLMKQPSLYTIARSFGAPMKATERIQGWLQGIQGADPVDIDLKAIAGIGRLSGHDTGDVTPPKSLSETFSIPFSVGPSLSERALRPQQSGAQHADRKFSSSWLEYSTWLRPVPLGMALSSPGVLPKRTQRLPSNAAASEVLRSSDGLDAIKGAATVAVPQKTLFQNIPASAALRQDPDAPTSIVQPADSFQWLWDPDRQDHYLYTPSPDGQFYLRQYSQYPDHPIQHPADNASHHAETPGSGAHHERTYSRGSLPGQNRQRGSAGTAWIDEAEFALRDKSLQSRFRQLRHDTVDTNTRTHGSRQSISWQDHQDPPAGTVQTQHTITNSAQYGYDMATSSGLNVRNIGATPSYDPNESTALPQVKFNPVVEAASRRATSIEFTDPDFARRGIWAHKEIKGTPGTEERLDPRFRKQKQPSKFFTIGRVFKVLWIKHADQVKVISALSDPVCESEKYFSKIRWFVVIKAGSDSSSCLEIRTYCGEGTTGQSHADPRHHSLIFSLPTPPETLPGEERLVEPPIRVVPARILQQLKAESRVNFRKIYAVEHHVKVMDFGVVHEGSRRFLRDHFRAVWEAILFENDPTPTKASASPSEISGAEVTQYAVRTYVPSAMNAERLENQDFKDEEDFEDEG